MPKPFAADCVFQFERRECMYYTGGRKPKKRRKVVLAPGKGRYFDENVQLRWMAWQACWEYLTGATLSDA
jgi:hypothetical protein